jgi:peroxiredoxin
VTAASASDDLLQLPSDLPVPVDDGACDHLPGMRMPPVTLRATGGREVCLADLRGWTVVYTYPRTGEDGLGAPPGWDAIPGARGCTPQTCGFRDHHAELASLRAAVFGLSAQTSEYQREMVERLHVRFDVLSDVDLEMARALRLPTFSFRDMTLMKRITLFIHDGVIEHVIYPVFPPDRSAAEAVRWLRERVTSS